MKHFHRTEEGFSASCLGPRGCWSQSKTDEEALDSMRSAIRVHFAARAELLRDSDVRRVEVTL
jgi:predicted RNase H-like HicB family nuclease